MMKQNGTLKKSDIINDEAIVRSIPEEPITYTRKPYIGAADSRLLHPGTARANIAPSEQCPNGTQEHDWARKHRHQTVLQQHCDFFDQDRDGVVWPYDTFVGFNRLGFGIFLSCLAAFIIHVNFSYPTSPSWIPDPFFRIYLKQIDRTKHGSDTGTYDSEGRFVPQNFENIFTKYCDGRDYMTIWDIIEMWKGQRCVNDPIGWGGQAFEWTATWLMLWPEDGRMMKEDIRGVFDGSIFYTIAARRAKNQPAVPKSENTGKIDHSTIIGI